MKYLIADTHFNHKNICRGTTQWTLGAHDAAMGNKLGVRPYDTLEEMNEDILRGINRVVGPDDELYHLGDFAFGDKNQIPALRDRINAKIVHLIMGNHDVKYVEKKPHLFTGFQSIQMYKELRYHGVLFSLMHYPLGSWNEIGKGGINLHGHCHGNYTRTIGRQMDVGVDVISYPISIEDVYNTFKDLEPVLVDGHTSETNYG